MSDVDTVGEADQYAVLRNLYLGWTADRSAYVKTLSDLNIEQNRSRQLSTDLSAALAKIAALEAGQPAPSPIPPPPVADTTLPKYPDATDSTKLTGPRKPLTDRGSLTVTTPGMVISGQRITGTVSIRAENVKLVDCEIVSTGANYTIQCRGYDGFVVENCRVIGGTNGIDGRATVRFTEIKGCENCLNITGKSVAPIVIEYNWFHAMAGASSAHYDCVQIDGNTNNITIRNNRIHCDKDNTSAVMIDNYFGSIDNVVVDSNWLGGGSFPAYCDGHFNSNPISGVKYTNNDMMPGGWGGYFNVNSAPCARSGNKNAQTGANVDNA